MGKRGKGYMNTEDVSYLQGATLAILDAGVALRKLESDHYLFDPVRVELAKAVDLIAKVLIK